MTEEQTRLLRRLVDAEYYYKHYPDVAAQNVDASEHYAEQGWREGRNPNAWFETSSYLADHPEIADQGINPLSHFATSHSGVGDGDADAEPWELGLIRLELDAAFYMEALSASLGADLAGAEIDPATHYFNWGSKLGLDPAPWFSCKAYLAINPDVAEAGIDPFVHYIAAGRSEGRPLEPLLDGNTPSSEPDPELLYVRSVIEPHFRPEYYLGENPDVAQAGLDPLEHFLVAGWMEGRDPSPFFSTSSYLALNPDVASAQVNPFFHYIVAGRSEGRVGKINLGPRYDILQTVKPVEERLKDVNNWYTAPDTTDSRRLYESLGRLVRSEGEELYISISHDDFTANFGGVQLCLLREAKAVADEGIDHVHLYPIRPMPVVSTETDPLVGVLVNGERVGVFRTSVVGAALQRTPRALTGQRSFAVHSLLGHAPDALISLLSEAGCQKGAFWLHDYASVCSNYTLMRNDVQFCGAPPISSGACGICVYQSSRAAQVAMHQRLFAAFDITVLAPSEAALETWLKGSAFKASRTIVHPHSHFESRPAPFKANFEKDRPLRVAFLGLPVPHKGWHAFRELALRFEADARYEFWHLGKQPQRGLSMIFRETTITADCQDAMIRTVEREAIDVAIVWSLWPETYCFTAHEALAGGAAVFAQKDGGNIPRLIQKGYPGVVLDDEKALEALFASGEALKFSRSARPSSADKIVYSNMTGLVLRDMML